MAISRIQIPPDAKRDAKAAALVPQVKLWHVVTLKQPHGSFSTGTVCLLTPGGYYVNNVACTCPDYAVWEHICKHVRAVVLADQQGQSSPPKRIEDIWPCCDEKDCTDDREPGYRYCFRHSTVDAF